MEPATERVPAEIWLEIFEQLPKGTDLHSISVTCRKFNQLSARALHRDVVWYRAKLVAHDLNTWERNVGMEAAVRSLVLGVSRLPQGLFASAVERDGRMSQSTGVDARSTGTSFFLLFLTWGRSRRPEEGCSRAGWTCTG